MGLGFAPLPDADLALRNVSLVEDWPDLDRMVDIPLEHDLAG